MYPGAMTFLIPRFIYVMASVAFVAILCWILMIGADLTKPVTGFRRSLLRGMF
jgi:hypothetical protein